MQHALPFPKSTLCLWLTVSMLLLAAQTAFGQHAFIQSTFNTDATVSHRYDTLEEKVLRAKAYSLIFTGTEVGNYFISGTDIPTGLDSSVGRAHVREVSQAMKQAFEDTGRPFIGHFSFPRLPGFFWPNELASQPASWRSQALKSNGSLWTRAPLPFDDGGSRHAYNGWSLDVTNEAAVNQLLANLAEVFDQAGGAESVGPLYGYMMIDETTLAGLYDIAREPDVNDDPQAGFQTRMRLGGGKKHFDLWWDDDPYYSFLVPPKRTTPLYSTSAQQSFAAYAAAHGHPEIVNLPADRLEFNDTGTVTLPSHVQWVDLSNTTYWNLWGDWCYATYSQFIEAIAREVAIAQRGNPDFRGVLLFQTPTMISFRDSSQQPITFKYLDANNQTATETTTLANYFEFDPLNHWTNGMDGDYLLQSPWIAGLIFETAAMHKDQTFLETLTVQEAEDFLFQHHRYKYHWMAQGALARQVTHANSKVFGSFVKSRWLKSVPPPTNSLPPADFANAFEHVIVPLEGEIVSTIGPRFLAPEMLDPMAVDPINPPTLSELVAVLGNPPHTGELQTTWLSQLDTFRSNFDLMFSENPWPHTVEHGQATALHAAAAGGTPDPNTGYEYRWQDSPNGASGTWRFTPIGGADGITDSSSASLVIPNPRFDNSDKLAGNNRFYRCRIRDLSGQAGQRFSPPARLTVLAPATPPLIVSNPSSTTVTEGSGATFSITASGGTTPYWYRWFYSATINGTYTALYNSQANITGSPQPTLHVNPAGETDEGWYKCRVRDSANPRLIAWSQPAQLTVEPESGNTLAVTDPLPMTVNSGEGATFTIAASGGSTPYDYRWFFSSTSPDSGFTALYNSQHNILGSPQPTLHVNPTSSTDEGWYKCRVKDASNPRQEVWSQPARLTVNTGAGPTCGGLLQEAEHGARSGRFVLGNDSLASNQEYVHVPQGAAPVNGVAGGPDKVSFCFQVSVAGNYRLEGRHFSPDFNSDSFFVSLGDPAQETFNWVPQPIGQWVWDDINNFNIEDPISRFFAVGDHRIDVFLREDGARLDAVELTPVDVACGDLAQEAEAGDRSGRFTRVTDTNASGDEYVHVPEGLAPGLWPAGGADRVRMCVRVPTAGTYRLRGHHYSPSPGADSFWVQLDGEPAEVYQWVPSPLAQWTVDDVNNYNIEDPIDRALTAGSHFIDVFLREDGTRLDRIELELQ